MPTVKELEPLLKYSSQIIRSLPGVEKISVWGSYVENIKNKNTPIREVELFIKCSFNSGDLLAIEKGSMGPFHIPFSELEEEGFNPKAVVFTKGLIKSCNFKTNYWCLSSDKKILHWGHVVDSVEEWKNIRNEAEKQAELKTGCSRGNLKKENKQNIEEWIQSYENTIRLFVDKEPLGWHQVPKEKKDSSFFPFIVIS